MPDLNNFKDWDQDPNIVLSIDEVIKKYERGESGVYDDPAGREELAALVTEANAQKICDQYGYADSFAGQLVIPFVDILKCYPNALPAVAQGTNDCSPKGTPVILGDGSVIPIEEIHVGDTVLTCRNRAKTVLKVIKKKYSGNLIEINVGRKNPLRATPEHLIPIYRNKNSHSLEWVRIDELKLGNIVFSTKHAQNELDTLESVFLPLNEEISGIGAEITGINSTHYDGDVYCLVVEDDRSFIADNYVVSNCVSHNQRNANMLSLCYEVVHNVVDEVTGKLEKAPKVSREVELQGVFATEPYYWYRGGAADKGMSCSTSAKVSLQTCGLILRQNYPGFIDLTEYSPRTAVKYGGRLPEPEDIDKYMDNNLLRDATICTTFEEIRDLLGRGFGIGSCGGEGFENTRDENGVSKRRGSWSHALSLISADDRPEIHKKYGGPLVLILNSWGSNWNKGPRKIYGTDIEIPEGSFWARWSDVRKRYYVAMSGVNGWEREQEPIDWLSPFK